MSSTINQEDKWVTDPMKTTTQRFWQSTERATA